MAGQKSERNRQRRGLSIPFTLPHTFLAFEYYCIFYHRVHGEFCLEPNLFGALHARCALRSACFTTESTEFTEYVSISTDLALSVPAVLSVVSFCNSLIRLYHQPSLLGYNIDLCQLVPNTRPKVSYVTIYHYSP